MCIWKNLKSLAVHSSIIVAALVAAKVARAAEIEAKKKGVEIYAEATNKSAVLGKLDKGEALPSVERKGMYWQVKLGGDKTGYVSVLAVTRKPGKEGNLAKAIKGAVKGGRSSDETSEARARSAVMGVRGLREDDNAANAGSARPNLRAVYAMEDRLVKAKKIEQLGARVFKEIEKKAAKAK